MFGRLLQSENKFRRKRAKAFAKAMVSVPMLQTVCYVSVRLFSNI
jgi:hypothetical protein